MSVLVKELLKGKRVVLGSNSPRRRELLHILTDDFEVQPSHCEEIVPEGIPAQEVPICLAEQKCRDVVSRCQPDDNTIVIGCDTVVILGSEILGKPKDQEDAFRMLSSLCAETHRVVSGLCVWYKGRYHTSYDDAWVTFSAHSEEELRYYVSTGEPMDKAGAYGIQELGGLLASNIEGDYYSIVGLPVNELAAVLTKMLTDCHGAS